MFENQPKGLWTLALANTGERFGYYTMLAVFALFWVRTSALMLERHRRFIHGSSPQCISCLFLAVWRLISGGITRWLSSVSSLCS